MAIALYFINILANLTKGADVLKYLTPFGYADGSDIITHGAINGTRLLIGMGLAACGLVLAYIRYNRKDIR